MTDKGPETPSREHSERDVALQQVIDELAAHGRDRPVDELAQRLVTALHERGLPAMPPSWVRAVAESAAAGNPYVVSPDTARSPGFPDPATPAHSYGVE